MEAFSKYKINKKYLECSLFLKLGTKISIRNILVPNFKNKEHSSVKKEFPLSSVHLSYALGKTINWPLFFEILNELREVRRSLPVSSFFWFSCSILMLNYSFIEICLAKFVSTVKVWPPLQEIPSNKVKILST